MERILQRFLCFSSCSASMVNIGCLRQRWQSRLYGALRSGTGACMLYVDRAMCPFWKRLARINALPEPDGAFLPNAEESLLIITLFNFRYLDPFLRSNSQVVRNCAEFCTFWPHFGGGPQGQGRPTPPILVKGSRDPSMRSQRHTSLF